MKLAFLNWLNLKKLQEAGLCYSTDVSWRGGGDSRAGRHRSLPVSLESAVADGSRSLRREARTPRIR
jgi:hypothetical protein